MTHGGGVDEDDNDYHQQEDDDAPNDVPLVVAPDDVLEGLPGRREPQERGGWTTVCVCACVCVCVCVFELLIAQTHVSWYEANKRKSDQQKLRIPAEL